MSTATGTPNVPIIERTCFHPPVERETLHRWSRNLSNYRVRRAAGQTTGTTVLGVPIVYRVLYNDALENISFDRIRDNHIQLNECFNATNADISRVPTTGVYGFASSMIGDSKIVFMPQDADLLTNTLPSVTRDEISEPVLTLTEAVNLLPPIDGWLNVYIGPMPQAILGEANVGSNICMVTTGSVGGNNFPGTINTFDIGRTAVHEVGHCFSLLHPFDSQCILQINDLPKTKTPNRKATLSNNGERGNHWNDVHDITINTSCSGDSPPPVGYYEAFMVYMEYVQDKNMVMFTTGESEAVHVWLDTEGRDVIDVQEGDLSSLPAQPTPSPISPEEDSGLSTSTIILIVIGSILGATLIALIIYFSVRKT